jgi:hypothetical protein
VVSKVLGVTGAPQSRASPLPELKPNAGLAAWEGFVEPKLPEDGQVRNTPLTGPRSAVERTTFPWPWGLVAIGVMALAWVGIYLMWNGLAFLFGW